MVIWVPHGPTLLTSITFTVLIFGSCVEHWGGKKKKSVKKESQKELYICRVAGPNFWWVELSGFPYKYRLPSSFMLRHRHWKELSEVGGIIFSSFYAKQWEYYIGGAGWELFFPLFDLSNSWKEIPERGLLLLLYLHQMMRRKRRWRGFLLSSEILEPQKRAC